MTKAVSGSLDEDLFPRAMQGSPDPMAILTPEGRVRFVNPTSLALFKISDADAVRGRRLTSLAHPSVRQNLRQAIEEAADGQAASFEAEIPTDADPHACWQVSVSPIRDDEQAVYGLLAVLREVTDVKRAAAEPSLLLPRATATAAVLRSALRLAQLDAWRYDCIRERVSFTPELRDNLGRDAEDQPVAEALGIWVDEDREAFKRQLDEAARDCSEFAFEGRAVTPDGQVRWLRVLGEPEIVDGQCVALRGASQDITEQRAAEARLKASEEMARKAADAMSGFLATMSHEIRTPLNGVLGMAQAMAMGELPEAQKAYLKTIQASGEALLALLNDLLDLSKIEAGRIDLEDGLIDPESLADGARAFEPALEAKGVRLEVTVTPAVRGLWAGDVTRVRQVLNNLVSNAAKFTEHGTVEVRLSQEQGAFVMRVADSGIGIAPEKLGDVFNRFVQADTSTTRRFGGTGLGLAICKELVNMMGGTIRVESAPNKGTTFTVRLPLAHVEKAVAASQKRSHPTPEPIAPAVEDEPLRILAAEDNPTNQLVLSTLLSSVGIEPELASNGVEALEAWRKKTWDVILMDVHMPVLDGVEAVAEIRAAERKSGRPRTPIIALTANAMTHQRTEYLSAGMDAVVAKPIELAALLEAIASVTAEPAELGAVDG